jgi:hypothetical protein
MKKFLKFAGIFLAILILLIGLALFYLSTPEKVENKTTDISISAEQLYQEYEQDEAVSNQKYIDKIVQVKGTIAEMMKDENGAPVVVLRQTDAMAGVMCTLREDEADALASHKIGDEITVKGQCTGMLMDVVMNKCVLIQ